MGLHSLITFEPRLPPRLRRWSKYFLAAELATGVDPFLLAAICDREPLGGDALLPKGPSGTGDGGHGRGLMQIDDRSHAAFMWAKGPDGAFLWTKPAWSILFAAELLAQNLVALNGSVPGAVAAYNADLERVRRQLSQLTQPSAREAEVAVVDVLTTGHNYVADVLRRRDGFLLSEPEAPAP